MALLCSKMKPIAATLYDYTLASFFFYPLEAVRLTMNNPNVVEASRVTHFSVFTSFGATPRSHAWITSAYHHSTGSGCIIIRHVIEYERFHSKNQP